MRAMDLGTPDRVPLMCQLSIGHFFQQLDVSPAEFWYDAGTFADGLVEMRARYDFDGILVSLHGHSTAWRSRVSSIQTTTEGEELILVNGQRSLHLYDDLPLVRKDPSSKKPSLESFNVGQLPETVSYIPVSQGLHFEISPSERFRIFHLVREKAGETYSIHGEVTSPFDYYLDFFGLEEGLMGLINHGEMACRVLAHFARLVSELASDMCATGVDAVKISSPFAGASLISCDFYRDFVLPFERSVAQAIRKSGVHAYTHTCGGIKDRLELMFESGVSGIECLDPPPLGNVELEDAKKRTFGRGFIKGNVDSVNTLLRGNEDTILADARKRIQTGKENGGYIFSTACSVAPYVPRKNMLLLREAVERWG
jgi:hypothetical protein